MFKDLVRKLMGGKSKEEIEENKRRIKKLMDKYMTHHLLSGLKEGEVKGYIKGWYKGSNPVIGITHSGMMNFNEDLTDDLQKTFGLNYDDAKEAIAIRMIDMYNITEPVKWTKFNYKVEDDEDY
jgi:hypothetical protein